MKKILFWAFVALLIGTPFNWLRIWYFGVIPEGATLNQFLIGTAVCWGLGIVLISLRLHLLKKAANKKARAERELVTFLHTKPTITPARVELVQDDIREAVEDVWRQFLTHAALGQGSQGAQVIAEFDAQMKRRASRMAPAQGTAFYAMVEAEREKLLNEYELSPDRLKKRLGIENRVKVFSPQIRSYQRATSNRQGIGEMAVRTAIRATIWETIAKIIR